MLIAGIATNVAAETPSAQLELEELRLQIRNLQDRVERLEGNVAEGLPVNPARTVQALPGGWRKAHNWKLLVKGMEDADVVALLGESDRRKRVKKHDIWAYGDGKVRLYLGRLKSWELPHDIGEP